MSVAAPKRVLFILEYFPPHLGGVETLFGELAAEFVQRGIDVRVITSGDPGEAKRDRWRGADVIRIIAPTFARRYLFMLMAIPAALRAARDADVIHTTTYNAAIPAWIAAKIRRKPVVITAHEVFGRQWHEMPGMNRLVGYAYRLFERLVLRLPFDAYVSPSEFARRRVVSIAGVPEHRTRTVHNAIDYAFWSPAMHTPRDLKRELGLPPDTFVYLYFGRPGVSKGVEYLLDAAVEVRRRLPTSRLVMLLSPEPANQFRRMLARIDALGLRDHVVVRPPAARAELPSHLLATDCVVIPSLSEGFGYAAIEAATIGCRLITTRGHAVEELIPESATFVPARDATALANAIVEARTPHSPAPPRFTTTAHAEGILAVYRDLGIGT